MKESGHAASAAEGRFIEYLLSLQYENRGEKERAREYEDRSVKTLKDALEAREKAAGGETEGDCGKVNRDE